MRAYNFLPVIKAQAGLVVLQLLAMVYTRCIRNEHSFGQGVTPVGNGIGVLTP